jgi:hypothetical protein
MSPASTTFAPIEAPSRARPAVARRERAWLLLLLVALFAALQHRLGAVVIPNMDEGTYFHAGRLIERGLVPYRDFMVAHPPLLPWLCAALVRWVGDDLLASRRIYTLLVLLGDVPLYLLARRLTRSTVASLLAVATYAVGLLFIANMGRTLLLEPLMNALAVGGAACVLLRRGRVGAGVLGGALLAASGLVKLVAVLPALLLLAGDLLFDRRRETIRSWAAACAGGALVLAPALAWCLAQPNFLRDVLLGHVGRPPLEMSVRLGYVLQDCVRFPPIPIALAAAPVLIARSRDALLRTVALTALGTSVILVVAFRSFLTYYICQALPWLALVFAYVVQRAAERLAPRRAPALLGAGVLLAASAPVAYAEVYHRRAASHVAGPLRVAAELQRASGPVYSMFPGFALWARREPYDWYWQADSLVPRMNGWIGDDDFARAFERCGALVLFSGELDEWPRARAVVEAQFVNAYRDGSWALWVRRAAPARAPRRRHATIPRRAPQPHTRRRLSQKTRAAAAGSNLVATRARAARPIAARSRGWSCSHRIAAASAATSPAGTSSPVSPDTTVSRTPPSS